MKIVDVPQTGKLGLTVTYPGRNGLIRRTKVTPANPRSVAQLGIRQNLATQAGAYAQLSDTQQNAWIQAAAAIKSRPTLGQSGPLTGLQLFTKINCTLLDVGASTVTAPPAKPVIAPLPVDGLQITNTGGTIAIKLHTTGDPGTHTMLRASAPQSAGTRRPVTMRCLGTLGAPAADGYIDVTSAFVGRYGSPAVGTRVFVQVNATVNGYQGLPLLFSARVPSAA